MRKGQFADSAAARALCALEHAANWYPGRRHGRRRLLRRYGAWSWSVFSSHRRNLSFKGAKVVADGMTRLPDERRRLWVAFTVPDSRTEPAHGLETHSAAAGCGGPFDWQSNSRKPIVAMKSRIALSLQPLVANVGQARRKHHANANCCDPVQV
jgi:hypothetical protein